MISIMILCIALVLIAVLVVTTIRTANQNSRFCAELDALRQDCRALCAGAVGVDKRVLRLEQRGRDLHQRQESLESRHENSSRPYAEAIHSVHKGAGATRLVEEFGLTQNEAELIVMLHGMRETG